MLKRKVANLVLPLSIALVMLSYYGLSLGNTIYVGNVIPISAIQDTTGTGSPDSPLDGQVVTVEGIVSAESWAFGNNYYFIQDRNAPWCGIKVYDSDRGNTYGDSVRITATVDEYYGMTELVDVTEYVRLDSGKTVDPIVVTTAEIATGGINAEAYEGVLVRVENAEITNANLGYGEWEINDGSGACRVDDAASYYFSPEKYDSVKNVTGVLDYSYNDTKIQPRLAYDVVEGGEYTRIQRIQQVRYSDLLKTPKDEISDWSYYSFQYLEDDTAFMKVKGIVTMPTGLSYAGAGIKFIFGEPEGGPWSAVLSYNSDSTAYPVLYEGDEIEMSGYVGEYHPGSGGNMTEFWITSPIEILKYGQPLPPVDTIATGALRLPITAEQWGNVMVAVKNAIVTNVDPQYELFAVDDGTGEILIDGDSDSLTGYPDPPIGAIFESIKGWVYHHYGSYTDSSTYKLEPLYVEDLILGSGPPQLSNVSRNPGVPTSSDPVEVSVELTTNATIASADIYYSVNSGEYQTASMSESEGSVWTGTIPAQSDGDWVDYFIKVVDIDDRFSLMPADTSVLNYSYVIRDAGLTISDIQYTPWPLGDSPFNDCEVTVTGIVTADTTTQIRYGAYAIQDGEGPWNGVFLFGVDDILLYGDEVQVWGTVSDYNPDYHYKWDNNTVILVDSVKVLTSGNTLPNFSTVGTGDLSQDSEVVESYEATLVRVENFTITSINRYDITVDDGSGPCLVDADGIAPNGRDQDPNPIFYINDGDQYVAAWGDTLYIGDVLNFAQGFFTFSFGTYKIELRGNDDFGNKVGINENPPEYPLTYKLSQNYPNPFNPETRIYFEIPNSENVTIAIYNVLGQRVRSLVMDKYPPGHYIVNWDGRNDYGELVSSGTYILRMKAGNYIESKKMLLIR
jgi:hypothetical protein